ILSPGLRLGWAVAPRPVLEKLNLGKQGADLCSSPVTQMFVAAYFERDPAEPGWLDYVERLREVYRARRDAMLEALEQQFGEHGSWTRPQGGMFVWATLDGRIDTNDLLALATKEGVAFVPGRAAYMDGRSGSSSMRLNFAGIPEANIHEGIRRIGKALRTQLGLLGSLTGAPSARAPVSASAPAPEAGAGPMADVLPLPRRERRGDSRRLRDR
ncbi:MAG: aminotransferase class I/II-fold pyridoxal phosphate-dependent enzyme, partial [Solirubrobacteraceae bacterium]